MLGKRPGGNVSNQHDDANDVSTIVVFQLDFAFFSHSILQFLCGIVSLTIFVSKITE